MLEVFYAYTEEYKHNNYTRQNKPLKAEQRQNKERPLKYVQDKTS